MIQLHATTVAFQGQGVLILGPSGSGKSTLALQLMAVGSVLVADDRTDVVNQSGVLVASCPSPLQGKIEARGLGILAAEAHGPVRLALAVDLGAETVDRLPRSHSHEVLGIALPLVSGPYRSHLYAAVRQLLVGGRVA
ncbi:HPr kinase/phosphatase C-terminal domain-containing protein [Paracoccus caeni]|uniref:HPr kinase/phosphatase C-terminal domain-containing protein n=1 Tax=Paracoccus caeni TaxID=657651 RepID=A0A934SEF4_9RHOB|nr:HPr kinase/phosphatase C-terminal domain-containing protein [Paracoccus caeni]MBK4215859.1 HPr kinase/phosphatase C-terminal domain-containing protein [Paracoccus caeni]